MKKRMKFSRLACLAVAFCMAAVLLPAAAFAESENDKYAATVDTAYGSCLGITTDGVHVLTESRFVPDEPRHEYRDNSRNNQFRERDKVSVHYTQNPATTDKVFDVRID